MPPKGLTSQQKHRVKENYKKTLDPEMAAEAGDCTYNQAYYYLKKNNLLKTKEDLKEEVKTKENVGKMCSDPEYRERILQKKVLTCLVNELDALERAQTDREYEGTPTGTDTLLRVLGKVDSSDPEELSDFSNQITDEKKKARFTLVEGEKTS